MNKLREKPLAAGQFFVIILENGNFTAISITIRTILEPFNFEFDSQLKNF